MKKRERWKAKPVVRALRSVKGQLIQRLSVWVAQIIPDLSEWLKWECVKCPMFYQMIQDIEKRGQRDKVNMQKLLNTFNYSEIVIKVICKYIFLAKLIVFEITIIKNNWYNYGLKLRLVWLQQFTFIRFLSVFLSAFPSHNVHLIYLESNTDLQSSPHLFGFF